jgi:hypothetical protein
MNTLVSRAIRLLALATLALLAGAASVDAQTIIDYQTLDNPNGGTTAYNGTVLNDTANGNISGDYYASNGKLNAFVYNGSAFTALVVSGSRPSTTYATGIDSGGNVVGYYDPNSTRVASFIYNDGTYTTYQNPASTNVRTYFESISDGNVAGYYESGGIYDGVVYNIANTTYTELNDPLANDTALIGIDGGNIVGQYNPIGTPNITDSFFYNGSIFTPIVDPNAAANSTWVDGISGDVIVGFYEDSGNEDHGFVDIGGNYITVDEPNANLTTGGTSVTGTDGGNIVGVYFDNNGAAHGFTASISGVPEPSSYAIGIGCSALALAYFRRKKARARTPHGRANRERAALVAEETAGPGGKMNPNLRV